MTSAEIGNPVAMTTADSELWAAADRVGASALAAVTARQLESDSPCPLFWDPYAKVFADAAVAHGCALPDGEEAQRVRTLSGYLASRTKWFDEFFIAAGAHGVEQAVIVAGGLDARAWRLPWTSRSAVYELDQPAVLALKAETLRGEQPGVQRYAAIPVDESHSWPEALCAIGFDPSEPSAWAVEGALPTDAADPQSLLERIHALSATGSKIALEVSTPGVPAWLTARGWELRTTDAIEIANRYGRCGGHIPGQVVPDTVFVDGKLPLTPSTGIPPLL
jgi:methyltransferase (TIGR00027 family)